ncbi:hypothetical protein CYMTET_18588 [Cymbomonas tetramitiformis]|uniref:Uncharacterized protein n=1 Tax=Cymbomonas tetramitiformis TaxID=36881 RepID=A0AAE0G7R8_9CHLO|nr:hypothetical protein CYMTET_18588 [Cymbomonas tetramitiformis]
MVAKKQLLASLDTALYDKLKHRFAAKPLNDGGNSRRQQYYKKESAHNISFHVASFAFIPECARWPPGHYHDTANCPTDDKACAECDLTAADESDEIVSAFQTAFDVEDDAAFSRSFVFDMNNPLFVTIKSPSRSLATSINIGLWAQYAGLRADFAAPHSALAVRVQEARNSLRQLKQAAGGAGEVHHFPMVHFDSATTVEDDTVKHDAVDIAASDTGDSGMPFRKQFPDSEPPFEDSFIHGQDVLVLGLQRRHRVSFSGNIFLDCRSGNMRR